MATQWTVLRVDDLRSIVNETDFGRLRNLDTQINQPDPAAITIAEAVNAARGQIAAGGYRLSRTANAVPPSLARDVLWTALEDIWLRVVRMPLTDDQARRITAAREALARVAEGRRSVETPVDPEGSSAVQQPPRGTTIVRPGKRPQYNAKDFNGLI